MKHQVVCTCGNVLPISEGQAGSAISCRCGRIAWVSSLSELRSEAITENVPPAGPSVAAPPEPVSSSDLVAEIIAPTEVWLRTAGGLAHGHSKRVMAALTTETLWIQDAWQVRPIPVEELEQNAEKNAASRMHLELIRPTLGPLRREAELLIDGRESQKLKLP